MWTMRRSRYPAGQWMGVQPAVRMVVNGPTAKRRYPPGRGSDWRPERSRR
jgi:hypothetical protein